MQSCEHVCVCLFATLVPECMFIVRVYLCACEFMCVSVHVCERAN